MPNFSANLNITTGRGDTLSASKSGSYNEILNIRQEVDNTNTFIAIVSCSDSKGTAVLSNSESLIIKNSGTVGAEIKIGTNVFTDGTPDTTGGVSYQYFTLGGNDFIFFPNIRQMGSTTNASTGNAYTLDNQAPDANRYVALNNVAAGDAQLVAEAIDGSETEIDVDEGAYFYVGDLIRVEDEIMEVTGISSNTLTVIRGTHGSSAASHSDNTAIRLPFFNKLADFDKYSTARTDGNGRFEATNFFGYARNTDGSGNRESNGIVAGSLSLKFYEAGYQELGLSNLTSSTNSGLTASTTYQFTVACDGASATNIAFTTDSSDLTFGGTNGIINKIQDALNTQFYTTGSNLFEKKVTVSLVNGDVRFTSGQSLRDSKIVLADSSGSDTDIWGVGRFPAVANVEANVDAKLPPDEIIEHKSGLAVQNTSKLAWDDGHGRISGVCSGTINYETGAISLSNAPRFADFVFSVNYGSSQSGGNRFGSDSGNSITVIAGRSMNSKIDTTIEVIGLK
tara:strand:+ start:215 stop:1741 length:1527 start_codon:yes stop_codon:yes gene_type:complete